jgi:hypothetical protein
MALCILTPFTQQELEAVINATNTKNFLKLARETMKSDLNPHCGFRRPSSTFS